MRRAFPLFVFAALLGLQGAGAIGEEEAGAGGGPVTENRLAGERSPYLRQHRTNPVDWYPWGPEALTRAREENRPIFLSVGYAACHWCHVMEHESFEDEGAAAALNRTFVCIKVDREERPDVDALYMQSVHVMSGRGGWPMTVVLTPEGEPFFAATYLPRERLLDLTQRIGELWKTDEERLRHQATVVAERVRELASGWELPEAEGSDTDLLRVLDGALAATFDETHGGYGSHPKFPPHAELLHLLDRAAAEGGAARRPQIRRTLDAMADGGVHDQVGGGFHRYSTDERWFLPHFEKMLYDNALLAQAYAGMYERTGEARYAEVVRGIFAWLGREMIRPGGGYASSLDADTDGEEGLTYTWTADEIRALLPPVDADLAIRLFGITNEGNFHDEATGRRTGKSLLYLPQPLAAFARAEGLDPATFAERVAGWRSRLRRARDGRPQPGLDDKVITAWNGLLLSAFARAGQALGDPELLEAGKRLARTLLDGSRRPDGTLLRFPRGSGAEIPGFCEDYVHTAEGLLDLAEATGEAAWADEARGLADLLLEHFEDRAEGGFFTTSTAHHEVLFSRRKESFDSPIPSDNGAAARLLLRLAARTGDARLRRAADRTLDAWRPLLANARAARGIAALYRALALRVDMGEPPSVADASAGDDLVRVEAFLRRDEVKAGATVRLALRVTVDEGWHVNPAAPAGPDLEPTALTLSPGAPAVLQTVTWPPVEDHTPSSGGADLEVWKGTFWIHAELVLPAGADSGSHSIPLVLTYQPCSDATCRDRRDLRVDLTLQTTDESGPVRHPDVFSR